jgi:hypothetical protein
MKVKFYLTILVLSLSFSVAMAKSDPRLIELIKKDCQFMDETLPLDNRIDCMTDYINCAIVGSGETDLTKLTNECLNRKARERRYEQRIQNSSRSGSSTRKNR